MKVILKDRSKLMNISHKGLSHLYLKVNIEGPFMILRDMEPLDKQYLKGKEAHTEEVFLRMKECLPVRPVYLLTLRSTSPIFKAIIQA
jgi:hypothetical protein